MGKSEYAEKLKDPRWQKKRLEILERDGWKCVECGDKETTLHVHHIFYLPKTDPWEIQNGYLVSLCERCHKPGPCDEDVEKCEDCDSFKAVGGLHCDGFSNPPEEIKDTISELLNIIWIKTAEEERGHWLDSFGRIYHRIKKDGLPSS